MRKCRTVRGLIRALKKGEKAELKVWDIMPNYFDKSGAYLNLGEGKYCMVGSENWDLIKDHVKLKKEAA